MYATKINDANAYQCNGCEHDFFKSEEDAAYNTQSNANATIVPSGTIGHVIVENKHLSLRVNVPIVPSLCCCCC